MARVSIYLNFPRSTEQAFNFYKSVFGTEFTGEIMRYGDIPPSPDQPPMSEADKNLIMHMELPILGGFVLMGTDAPESMGHNLKEGNNITLNLEPDTRAETDRLFAALAEGGEVGTPLAEMFWGGYYGDLKDKFGLRWMFNCTSAE
ncbi:MAG: VOC family protein [Caldilineales bacterium]|nr:VOC family protein [Caldilineales bacterium]